MIIPAIDILGGRVVRLRQGDFDRRQAYADDPAAVAESFVDAGAGWLHVVDLDGAREGTPRNGSAIARLLEAIGSSASVEVAGGLRIAAAVDSALAAGAARVVLGTAALHDPALLADAVARHGPDRVAIALDVRAGLAVGEGWRTGAEGVRVEVALDRLADVGVRVVEVTAVARDGLLEGPDLELVGRVAVRSDLDVVASGGIRSIEDLLAARDAGCRGAIVGRALYEGTLDLAAAITALG